MPNPKKEQKSEKRITRRMEMLRKLTGILPGNYDLGGFRFNDLNDRVQRLRTGKKKLDIRETTELMKDYARCGAYLAQLFEKSPVPEISNTYFKLIRKLTKDYSNLSRYRNQLRAAEKRGEKIDDKLWDIDQFFEKTTTRTVSLNGGSLKDLKKYGGGQNIRYSVTMPLKDEPLKGVKPGELFNSFFTEDKDLPEDYIGFSDDYLLVRKEEETNKIVEKYPALKQLLAKGSESRKMLTDYNRVLRGTKICGEIRLASGKLLTFGTRDDLLDRIGKEIRTNMKTAKYSDQEIKSELAPLFKIKAMDQLTDAEKRLDPQEKDKLLRQKKEAKNEAVIGLLEYLETMMKMDLQDGIKSDLKMNKNTGAGQRNALTSNLAEYFGCGDVIAFSEKMNLKVMENGKEVVKKGIMMMPAQGEDHGHVGPDSNSAKLNKLNVCYSQQEEAEGKNAGHLIKEIASLQFLDLICGNTDRHSNNFFLKFDEQGRLSGVQGIDNDTSFGSEMNIENLGHSVEYENLRIIPKTMADAVMNTDKNVFYFMLQGYGLSLQEAKTVTRRFETIRKQLEQSEKKYKDAVPGYLDPNVPRIVPDEEMHLYSITEQLGYTPNPKLKRDTHQNLFARILPADNLITLMTVETRYMLGDITNDALNFKKAFIEKSDEGIYGNLKTLQKLDNKEYKAQREEEPNTDQCFRKMRDSVRKMLKDPVFRQDYVVATGETAGRPGVGLAMVGFVGQEVRVTEDQKKERKFERLPDEAIQRDLPAYKKMQKTLEDINDYLYDDEVVAIADRYQELQAELGQASGKDRKTAMKKLQTFCKSSEFKKYHTAVDLRNQLTREISRFEDMQKDCYTINQAKEFVNHMRKTPNVFATYENSPEQTRIINRLIAVEKEQMDKNAVKNTGRKQQPVQVKK